MIRLHGNVTPAVYSVKFDEVVGVEGCIRDNVSKRWRTRLRVARVKHLINSRRHVRELAHGSQ